MINFPLFLRRCSIVSSTDYSVCKCGAVGVLVRSGLARFIASLGARKLSQAFWRRCQFLGLAETIFFASVYMPGPGKPLLSSMRPLCPWLLTLRRLCWRVMYFPDKIWMRVFRLLRCCQCQFATSFSSGGTLCSEFWRLTSDGFLEVSWFAQLFRVCSDVPPCFEPFCTWVSYRKQHTLPFNGQCVGS